LDNCLVRWVDMIPLPASAHEQANYSWYGKSEPAARAHRPVEDLLGRSMQLRIVDEAEGKVPSGERRKAETKPKRIHRLTQISQI